MSELTLAAECARTDGESARAELERVRSRHQRDTQAFEKRQKQLVTSLRAAGGQTEPFALADSAETNVPGIITQMSWGSEVQGVSGGSTPTGPFSDALLAVRDRNQSQAIQEAELAVAIMQVPYLCICSTVCTSHTVCSMFAGVLRAAGVPGDYVIRCWL